MAEVPTLVFPGPSHSSNLNDNYCSKPNPLYVKLVEGKSVCCQTQCLDGQKNRLGCILSCCFSCSYCSFSRASAKERSKTRSLSEQNKACQRCMFCKSLPFCPTCFQCPQCCPRTECRRKTTKILANLASHGFKSSGSLYPQLGLHSYLQTKAPSDKVSFDPKRQCQPQKKHVLKRSSRQSHGQIGGRESGCQVVPRLLQPAFSGSQTQQQMETHIGSESAQFVPQHGYFQDGNSGDNPVAPTVRAVGLQLRWTSATPTFTSPLPKAQESISGSSCLIRLSSSQLCHSDWPQLLWSLPRWSHK